MHNVDFKVLYPRFTDYDVRFYMYELLKVRKIISSVPAPVNGAVGLGLLPFEGYNAP